MTSASDIRSPDTPPPYLSATSPKWSHILDSKPHPPILGRQLSPPPPRADVIFGWPLCKTDQTCQNDLKYLEQKIGFWNLQWFHAVFGPATFSALPLLRGLWNPAQAALCSSPSWASPGPQPKETAAWLVLEAARSKRVEASELMTWVWRGRCSAPIAARLDSPRIPAVWGAWKRVSLCRSRAWLRLCSIHHWPEWLIHWLVSPPWCHWTLLRCFRPLRRRPWHWWRCRWWRLRRRCRWTRLCCWRKGRVL